jgi:hypothetical protein
MRQSIVACVARMKKVSFAQDGINLFSSMNLYLKLITSEAIVRSLLIYLLVG